MKNVSPRTFERLVRRCQTWKCPRCHEAPGVPGDIQADSKGRYPSRITIECPCGAEHLVYFKHRRWKRFTIQDFTVDGVHWKALFDDPPYTEFSVFENGRTPVGETYVFEEIVEPSRFIDMIAFA